MSRIIFVLLLLIGSANAQDSTFNSGTSTTLSKGQFYFKVDSSYPRMTFSAELVVYDSMRLIGYQKKDSTLVIIGDSARFIKIILESMSWTREFKVRYAKRKYKQNLILIPGKGTIIIRYRDTIFSRIDTVKWKPYYQKKKQKLGEGLTLAGRGTVTIDSFRIGYNKMHSTDLSDTSWFTPYLKAHPVTGSTRTWRAINFDSFYLTAHGLLPKYKDSIYSIKGYNWDFWQTPVEAYPWWKKGLWMLSGAALLSLIVFLYVLLTEPKIG